LETARAEKKIGKSLEAAVTVTVPAEDAFLADMDQDELADLFIVSQAKVSVGGALSVEVASAAGEKCERCWKFHPHVGQNAAHPTLCPRCAGVIAKAVF
jgi:isoleucyl-tRNA synthetase